MKKYFSASYFVILVILVGLLTACGPAKIPTANFKEYSIPKGKQEQIKENVKIEAEVIRPSDAREYPELFKFDGEEISDHYDNGLLYFPEDSKGERLCYTFGIGEENMLTVLKVNVTNNTPHILRMGDSRIYLVVEENGEREPIKAVTKLGDATLVPLNPNDKNNDVYLPRSAVEKDESLVHWVTFFEAENEEAREKGIIDFPYPVGFASQVIRQNKENYKLINSVGTEILPDFSYSGILLFPAIVSFDNARLMFYDITTKTDAAGNPIEKTSFEFPLKLKETAMWYDRQAKEWKEGKPPKSN